MWWRAACVRRGTTGRLMCGGFVGAVWPSTSRRQTSTGRENGHDNDAMRLERTIPSRDVAAVVGVEARRSGVGLRYGGTERLAAATNGAVAGVGCGWEGRRRDGKDKHQRDAVSACRRAKPRNSRCHRRCSRPVRPSSILAVGIPSARYAARLTMFDAGGDARR